MQSQLDCRNNAHFLHAHFTAWQTLLGLFQMFSASELYYHIQWPKKLRRQFCVYCNHCSTNQCAWTMTILYKLTILLSTYSRGHAECFRPRTQHYTTIFDDRKHSGLTFMHTVVNAITINLPEQWPFYACSLYCLPNIAGVALNVFGLGTDTILPYSMTENIPESNLCIL